MFFKTVKEKLSKKKNSSQTIAGMFLPRIFRKFGHKKYYWKKSINWQRVSEKIIVSRKKCEFRQRIKKANFDKCSQKTSQISPINRRKTKISLSDRGKILFFIKGSQKKRFYQRLVDKREFRQIIAGKMQISSINC